MAGYQRQTAYKVWIADLISGEYVRQAGEWEPNYVKVKNLQVSRVNLVASVIDKYVSDNGEYAYVEVDDSTGVIRVKAWKEDVKLLEDINVGNMILVIGRTREVNSEICVLAEIVKKIENMEWADVRKKELKKIYGDVSRVEVLVADKKQSVEEEIVDSTITDRQKVLSIIEKKDEIEFDALIEQSKLNKEELDKIIKELLKEGEIYQPRAGILKIV